jgi:hypothetical protein
MKISPISHEEAASKYINRGDYQTFDRYKEVYIGYKELTENHRDLIEGMGIHLIKNLVKDNFIEFKLVNNKSVYSLYSIAKYKFHLKIIEKHYLEISEALVQMGLKKNISSNAHIYRFIYLHENKYLNLTILDRQINNRKKYFVEKRELMSFLKAHINLNMAAKIFKVELSTLRQYWLHKYSHPIILFHHANPDLCFVNKDSWLEFAKEKAKTKLLSREKASKELDISPDNFQKVVTEYKFYPEKFKSRIESASYFKESDIKRLIQIQSHLLKEYREKYYTNHEAASILGIKIDTLYNYGKEIESIVPPPIIQRNYEGMFLRKSGLLKLYLKKDVEKIKVKLNDKREFENILYQLQDSSLNIFFKILDQQGVRFYENGIKTKDYWFNYVKVKLHKSQASDTTKRNEIHALFRTTVKIVELTKKKEIFLYGTKEIRLSVFNHNVPKVVQLEIFKFLKKVEDSRQRLDIITSFKVSQLPNPYKEKTKISNDKTIYTIPEYIKLLDFVRNVELHKKKAIKEVQIIQSNLSVKKRYQYDSVWLYSVLHMNNAWRHADIISFPRLSLTNTLLEGLTPQEALEWLNQNDLSKIEIESLVNQAKALPLFHSKTKKKRYFFCSDDLKSAFAHAAVICELRARIIKPLSYTLIDLDNRKQTLKRSQEKNFFYGFSKEFCFKSKQMNRTLISLIYSVIKKMTNRNPLEITKYIRSHSDVETTNIYIDIPQEHMNFISKQLFDLGHFGYAYETLTQLVIGELPIDREKRTSLSLNIKEIFGDVYQIETLARYLNRLSKEQNSLKKVLLELSESERKELLLSIDLGQQPSKCEGYQCIYRKCEFLNRECEKCPFAVHHFYSLSEVSDNLTTFLTEYKEKFNNTTKQGEKIHLANILYSYLDLIKQAISKFGKENVSLFFENGLDGLREELSRLQSSKNITTVKIGDKE